MKKYVYLALGVLLVGTLVKASNQDKPEAKTRALTVKVNYKGAGTVDEKHKIFVFVFDSPDFMQGGALPIAARRRHREGRDRLLPNLSTSPVYVATAYDPSGSYDGAIRTAAFRLVDGSLQQNARKTGTGRDRSREDRDNRRSVRRHRKDAVVPAQKPTEPRRSRSGSPESWSLSGSVARMRDTS